jgi:rhamnose transport system permease protein
MSASATNEKDSLPTAGVKEMSNRKGRSHFRFQRECSVAGVLLLLLGILAWRAPTFYSLQPLLSLFSREAPNLLIACGMALVVITRQIDISVGSQVAVCSVSAGLLLGNGWSLPAVGVASILAGAALGAFNGFLVAALRLPSIVVTLATMVTWREGLRWIRQGEFVDLPAAVQWFGLPQTSGQITIIAICVIAFLIAALLLRYTGAGRWFFAVGSNAEAARLAGLRPAWVTFFGFLLLGILAGTAAFLNLAQSPQVDPKTGTALEMKIIAAVIVGGVAVSGGRGTLVGVFLGLLLLACISPALTHLHVQAYWERAIQGGIILLAVVGDGIKRRKANA